MKAGLAGSGRGADKRYLVLVTGRWMDPLRHAKLPLLKYLLASGERRVRVSDDGKVSHTVFRLLVRWEHFSLLEAELRSGPSTHQIRVHLAHLGFPIAGDDKYGDFALNRVLSKTGLKRMFLHSWKMRFPHPISGSAMALEAPGAEGLEAFLEKLSNKRNTGLWPRDLICWFLIGTAHYSIRPEQLFTRSRRHVVT